MAFNRFRDYTNVFKDHETYLLIDRLEHYIHGAVLQIDKLHRWRKKLLAKPKEYDPRNVEEIRTHMRVLPRTMARQSLYGRKGFLDAHFYFTCVGMISKLLKDLSALNGAFKDVHDEFRRLFKTKIRNDFEHVEDRIMGRENNGMLMSPQKMRSMKHDFFNFDVDKMNISFGERAYPVSKEAKDNLTLVYKHLIDTVHKVAQKNPNFLALMSLRRSRRRV